MQPVLQQFVRKSLIQITATFAPLNGGDAVPASATCELQFQTLAGGSSLEAVTLIYDVASGTWAGHWDSSDAGQCTVNYVVFCAGGVQAATQGQFQIVANAANVV